MHRIGVHLNALRAFEAAGRLSSISRAADELRVSHSTISHHVKGLEEALGVALFERRGKSVNLTETGAALLPVLSESFDAMSTALHAIHPAKDSTEVRVTVTPSFANRWLVPNLRQFRAQHENIDVQINSSLSLANLRSSNFDFGIRSGFGKWPGVTSRLLTPITMTPVCSPALIDEVGPIQAPQDLKKFTLLHADVANDSGIDSEWGAWLDAADGDGVKFDRGLSLYDPGLALQAAADGLGVAMGYVQLAQRELADGRLIAPLDLCIEHPWSYYVVTAKSRRPSAAAEAFMNWLFTESDQTTTGTR
ncbi:MAG: LysR substrate-binding domain-containing protein [Woeseiaceae bacterium]